jgi:hypothetical protein
MAKPSNSALCLATAALVAAVPAWAAGWPEVSTPDGLTTTDVSRHMIYNGADMQSRIFTSRGSQADVVAWYQRLWGRESVVTDFNGSKIVGHKEGMYYVTVQIRPDGQGSRGDIGIVHLPGSSVRPVLGRGLPRPENTTVINDIQYPDDPTPARTLALGNGLSVQQNVSYYREQLTSTGWKPAGLDSCTGNAPACVMEYEQGDRKMTLAVAGNGSASHIVINVLGDGALP